jgi:hypothetical protein
MESKILVPESLCHDDVVDYIATRYSISPEEVISHFMCQEGIIIGRPHDSAIYFEENEMAILRDMGIRPSGVEFTTTND